MTNKLQKKIQTEIKIITAREEFVLHCVLDTLTEQ